MLLPTNCKNNKISTLIDPAKDNNFFWQCGQTSRVSSTLKQAIEKAKSFGFDIPDGAVVIPVPSSRSPLCGNCVRQEVTRLIIQPAGVR